MDTPVGEQKSRKEGWPAKNRPDPTPATAKMDSYFHLSEAPDCPALHHERGRDLNPGCISAGLRSSVYA